MPNDPSNPRSVAARYDEGAAGFDARFAEDPATKVRFERIEAPHIDFAAKARRVLDLGTGTGRLLARLGSPLRVGIDVSKAMLREARRHGLPLVAGDVHALPFRDGSFDAVVAGNAVFAYLDYARAFQECVRVLVPGGHLVLHQNAARPLSLRALFRPRPPTQPGFLADLEEIRAPARGAGLLEEQVFLFRGLPFAPYLVALPERFAGRLYTHVTFVFLRPDLAR